MSERKSVEQYVKAPENLEVEKQKLLAEIEAALLKDPYSEESRFALIRVMGYSLSDALEIGKKVGDVLPDAELLSFPEGISSLPLYYRLHWLYFRQKFFFDILIKSSPFELDKQKPIFNLVKSLQGEHFGEEKIFIESVTDLEKKVDAFYTKVLPHRIEEKHRREDLDVPKEKKRGAPRNSTFEKAEATMERSKIFLEPHYYTGDLRDKILLPALRDGQPGAFDIKAYIENFAFSANDQDLKTKLLFSSHISGEDVGRCYDAFGLDQKKELFELLYESLERFRYQPDVVDSRMVEIAKKDLKKEIEAKLPTGYILEKDAAREWKVVVNPEYKSEKTPEKEQPEGSFFDLKKWMKTECFVPNDITDHFRMKLRKRKDGLYVELSGPKASYHLEKDGKLTTEQNPVLYFYSRSIEGRGEIFNTGKIDKNYFMTITLDSGKVIKYDAAGILIGCELGEDESRNSFYFCDLEPNDDRVTFVQVTPNGDLKKTVIYEQLINGEYPVDVFFLDELTIAILVENNTNRLQKRVLFYSLKTGTPTCIFTSRLYDFIRKNGSGIVCTDSFNRKRTDFFIRDTLKLGDTIDSYEDIASLENIVDADTLKFLHKVRKKNGDLIQIFPTGEAVENRDWQQIEKSNSKQILGEAYNARLNDLIEFSHNFNKENEIICKSDRLGTKVYRFPLWERVTPIFSWNGEHLFRLEDVNSQLAVATDENTVYSGFEGIARSQKEVCLVFYDKTTGKVSMYRRDLASTEEAKPSVQEYTPNFWDLRNLELLNAFETKEKAIEYFQKHLSSKTDKETLRQKVAHILGQRDKKRTLELAAKQNPEVFFSHMTQNFDSRSGERAATDFLNTFFPQYRDYYRRFFGFSKKRTDEGKPEEYLNPNWQERKVTDADPLQKHPQVIFTSRQKVTGFYPRAFLARYNPFFQTWSENNLVFSEEYEGTREQHTYTLPIPKKLKEVILPISEGGELVSERVVGIRKKMDGSSEEVRMYPVRDKSGIWSVDISGFPRGISEIVYSEFSLTQGYQSKESVLGNQKQYKERIIAEIGDDLTADIFDSIPLDWMQFLQTLQGKSIEEKVVAVQNFVHSICYYDFQNKQVMGLKDSLTPSERVKFMKERLSVLVRNEKNMGKKEKLKKKQLAGVCADFTLITTGLLRRVGVPAGVAEGFLVKDSDTITTKDAHGVVFVPLPTQKRGEYRPLLVETTPAGLTDEEEVKLKEIRVNYKILSEKEKDEIEKQEVKKLEEQLLELQKIYTEEKVLDILALQNGKLENALNTILQIGVKKHHTKIFESIFSLARYGGIDLDDTHILSDVAQKLIEEKRMQKDEINESTAGTELMHLFHEYIFRYTRDAEKKGETKTQAREHAFATLQKVLKAVSPHLGHIEKMAALVVLADLKAKGMSTFAREAKD